MVPERPEHQGGFVFLDRELRFPSCEPGVPGGGRGAVRIVLVQEIPFRLRYPGDKTVEVAGASAYPARSRALATSAPSRGQM